MKTSRLFLIIGLFLLITLACNAPLLAKFLPDADQTEGSETSDTDASTSTGSDESDRLIPHNTDGADVTYIPGATYQMGSQATDELADEDEIPQHQVTEDEFYIYTYEVTNQMYAACVDAGYCMRPQTLEEGPTSHYEDPIYAEYPVVGVDWVMARDYCAWAGARLPTEAEWELVSRGTDSLYYPWGEEEPTCEYVNMKGCFTPMDTQKVGYYLMGNSPYEVWDMSGNVWEWVHDWYGEEYYSISPEDNPIGPLEPDDPDKPLRVVRGGGLNSQPDKMRSASRIGLNPYRVFIDVGFRCVVGEELLFPAGYDHGHDRHERVPPDSADGGDSADDPDDDGVSTWISELRGSCPTEADTVVVRFSADASVPVMNVHLRYDGDLWALSCTYDRATLQAACEGDPPPGYFVIPPPSFPMDVCIVVDGIPDPFCYYDVPVWKPADCSVPFLIEPYCFRGEGGGETAHLGLTFPAGEPYFIDATANLVDIPCMHTDGVGFADCTDLPGMAGDELDIIASFEDGSTLRGSVFYPECGGPTDLGLRWELAEVGCIYPTPTTPEYYATIDTFLGDEVVFTSWRLETVEAPKSCSPVLGVPDRIYCTFAIRDWYTEMTYCATWVGGPGERCETFTGLDTLLPAHCPVDDDEPELGYCLPGPSPTSCGSNPCLPACPSGHNCIRCTLP